MIPMLALGASLAPELVRWLAGPRAGDVAEAVGAAVQAVTGTQDEQAVQAALEADPAKALELRVALAKIAADADRDERLADFERLKAELADTAHAREQSQMMAQARHPLAYGAAVVTAVLLGLFTYALGIVLAGSVPVENGRIADLLLGQLLGWVGAAITYWVGSSRGSAEKTEQAAARRAGA